MSIFKGVKVYPSRRNFYTCMHTRIYPFIDFFFYIAVYLEIWQTKVFNCTGESLNSCKKNGNLEKKMCLDEST